MISKFRNLSYSILTLLILVTAAGGTQVLYQSLSELGRNSSAVVQGTVTDNRSYWNENHTKIFTETTVTVDEVFKGQPGGVVRVVQLGGTVDNIRVTAHGALRWRPGEEIVLFLEDFSSDSYQVAGFSQGKFQVERDPRTGAVSVMRSTLSGAELVGAPGEKSADGEFQKMSLEKFMEEAFGERTPVKKN